MYAFLEGVEWTRSVLEMKSELKLQISKPPRSILSVLHDVDASLARSMSELKFQIVKYRWWEKFFHDSRLES